MASDTPDPARRTRRRRGLALSAMALVLGVLAAELGFRVVASRDTRNEVAAVRRFVLEGVVDYFEANPHTVYSRPRGRDDDALINSDGFRDREWRVEHNPGTYRILCLGASTTESGNSEGHGGSYPRQLERFLNEQAGTDALQFEVMNAGVSGWTSAETLVSWFLHLQDFTPDLVIVHLAANDVGPRNATNFRSDYGHYRKPWRVPEFGFVERTLVRFSDLYAWLSPHRRDRPTLADVTTYVDREHAWDGESLPPETTSAYRRNLRTIADSVESRGGRAMLVTMPIDYKLQHQERNRLHAYGIREHDEVVRELCRERGYLLADVAAAADAKPEEWTPFFLDLVHLAPEGNELKAEAIGRVLLAEWVPTLAQR